MGNEAADERAKRGSETQKIGPEPYCGVSECRIRAAMERWVTRQKVRNFNSLPLFFHFQVNHQLLSF